jgi:hypothetical protein
MTREQMIDVAVRKVLTRDEIRVMSLHARDASSQRCECFDCRVRAARICRGFRRLFSTRRELRVLS